MFKLKFKHVLRCLPVLLLVLVALPAPNISRANGENYITVDLFTDPAVDGCPLNGCSLREAILEAGAFAGKTIISLPEGEYILELVGAVEDTGLTDDLDIHSTMRLVGLGDPGKTVIIGTGFDRLIDIHGSLVMVELWNVSLYGGSSTFGGALRCANAALDLRDMNIAENYASQSGGGVHATNCITTMSNIQIFFNDAAYLGGGIYVSGGSLTIQGGRVAGNQTTNADGGGIYGSETSLDITACEIRDNVADNFGGGIFLNGESSSLALKSSLLASNRGTEEAGGIWGGYGTSMLISNSTISYNVSNGFAGGIGTHGQAHVEHSTIVNNVADANRDNFGAGGGLLFSDDLTGVTITNTILANNDDRSTTNFDDCARWTNGVLSSQGYNLVEVVGNCSFGATGDLPGVDPRLPSWNYNGGPLLTFALQVGSPAIDAGNPAAPLLLTDNRGVGFPRVVNGRVDIGAFEAWIGVFLPLIFR